MRPIDRFLERLESKGLSVEEEGKGWICQCPAHNDGRPSLSVNEAADGKVLLKCFAGCRGEAIVAALQMEMKELFPEKGSPSLPAPAPSRGRVEEKAKKEKAKAERKLVKTYYYGDEEGKRRHATCRYEPKDFNQYWITANEDKVWSFLEGWYEPRGKSWLKLKGVGGKDDDPPSVKARWFEAHPTYLYRLKHVLEAAKEEQTIWLCEGEKDADNLGRVKGPNGKHLTTTCQPMGAGKWKPEYTRWLKGARVKMVLDRDLAGYRHGILVYDLLEEAEVPIEMYLPAAGKDVSDHLEAGLGLEDFKPIERPLLDELALLAEEAEKEKRAAEQGAKASGGGDEPPAKKKRGKEPEPEDFDTGTAWERNDLANAKRFIEQHGEDLKHCARFGQWLSWNGSFWEVDETKGSPLMPKWEATLAEMKARLPEMTNDQERGAWGKWVKKSMDHPGFVRAMSFAQILPGIAVTPEDLDQEDDLIPVGNGVLDLKHMKLIDAARDQLFTRGVRIPYDPKADCPTWIDHLTRCTGGDAELLSVLHKVFGYTLTGRTDEQKLYFLYGEGKTGKSTTIWVLEQILGEFAKSIRKRYLMAGLPQGDEATVFASLKGARMVVAVEVQPNDRFEEGVVKMATGEDVITGRLMRENPFQYQARFKLFLTGNYRPRIEGQDHGIWRRFAMVPFDQQIQHKDPDHKKKLKAELPGILNWMAYGAARWYEEGGVGTCAAIDGATEEYREEQDVLRQFFNDCCVFEEAAKITSTDLFKLYKHWAKDGMILPWSITRFGREMTMREKHFSYQKVKRSTATTFLGIRGKEQWDE